MNYFEFYNIPVSLKTDAAVVKQKFYELSRKYHPDFYSNATVEEQAEVLEKSSMVNKAFKIFSNADETIKYVLQLKNLLEEEEKYKLPNDFLMEMMELNEELMEAKTEDDQEKITNFKLQVANIINGLYENVKQNIEHYKDDAISEKGLLQVKDYYFKKKYLNRILAGLD